MFAHTAVVIASLLLPTSQDSMDIQFEQLAARYIDEFAGLAPVSATALGDHRYDSQLNEVSDAARAKTVAFCNQFLAKVEAIDRSQLSRANQVDHALLAHELRTKLWRINELQEWAWNPTVYTSLCGDAVYGLMAREFAPEAKRLQHVADRLEQFPRLYREIRATLVPDRVPLIHAETAIKQNRGVVSILRNMVEPRLDVLSAREARRLTAAIATATKAVEEHQQWLENDLLANAGGDFRLGAKLYDEKLSFTLHSSLSRKAIREQAESELKRVRARMYDIAKDVYRKRFPYTDFPAEPSKAYQQAIIRAGLEMAYQDMPARGTIVDVAKKSLATTTAFVREKDLITLPSDPLDIIVMPEFQRGVSLAYCDSPGPLDVGQKTFYAVAPLPKSWTDTQVESFLREYNLRSIDDLTIHEAMPGHFVQLAHSNRYPSKLRAVLASGTFIEGWAVYTEQMMAQQGFRDNDPLMHLTALKWYLRGIANAILDQAIHTEGISREQAMQLMMEDTFQEEREAAGKWVRAQLTAAQLSTYFVGYIEHVALRRETEQAWGVDFDLKTYHDKVLSFGSPPVKFARALLLNMDVPE